MLAEPRRRQKYSINPRGLDWSNDNTKVGQRLLEKMGWTQGKALGLKEDGCKEHIKVSTKNDRKGIGCTQQHADNWIAHQEDFNSILSALNKDVNAQSTVATFSLHDKSKNSRSRVHYQKFTKGKDLSGYHATDLNCIFGERQKSMTKANHQQTAEVESESMCEIGEKNRSFGVLTVTSSTNIDSYFANKMMKLQSKTQKVKSVSEAVAVTENDISSACSSIADKYRKQKQSSSDANSVTDTPTDCDVAAVKTRKKRRKITVEEDCTGNDKPSQSHEPNRKLKKKSGINDSLTAESKNKDEKAAESVRKGKKKVSSATVASELCQPEDVSKKRKKSKHFISRKR